MIIEDYDGNEYELQDGWELGHKTFYPLDDPESHYTWEEAIEMGVAVRLTPEPKKESFSAQVEQLHKELSAIPLFDIDARKQFIQRCLEMDTK